MSRYEGTLYQFAAGDRSGVILGLNLTQAVAVFVPTFLGVFLRGLGGPFWLVTGGMWLVLIPITFKRYRGRFLSEWVATVIRWVWVRRWPRWWTETPWDGLNGEVPTVLAGLRIENHDMNSQPVAVIWDDKEFSAAAIVKLRGRSFDVLSVVEQDERLYQFARALGFSAGDGSPVLRFSWSQRSFRQSLASHRRFVDRVGRRFDRNLRSRYLELVQSVGDDTVRHETLLTVVVSQSAAGRRRKDVYGASGSDDRVERIVGSLDKELRKVELFLAEAGIEIEGRLNHREVATMLQEALDPTQALGLATRIGRIENKMLRDRRCGPIETELNWGSYRIDGGVHRSYRVTEWPRVPVRANWMPRLLARPTAARTVTVVFDAVPPQESAQSVNRQHTKLDTDERLAEELKRRVKSATRRARVEVEQRDEELSAGFPEMRFFGVVTISAPDDETLMRACEEFESSASSAMLTIAPCDGEQDLGWASAVPLCRGSVRAMGA